MKIDLHCHTKKSDGSATVSEVVQMAICQKIDVLSVTDHDTLAGSIEACRLTQESKIEIIVGTEISAFDYQRKRKVHILCYQPKKPEVLKELLTTTTDNRRKAMLQVLPVIIKKYPLPEEMIFSRAAGSETIYKQHVMHALMDAGYADTMFGEVFQELFSSQVGIAQTRVQYPDVREVLKMVQKAEGIAVMAHPGEYKSLDLLEELMEENMLAGAELVHPKNSESDGKVIREICEKYHKCMTGGTDFHGSYGGRKHIMGSFLTPQQEYEKCFITSF